jgi:hypothetical protein
MGGLIFFESDNDNDNDNHYRYLIIIDSAALKLPMRP